MVKIRKATMKDLNDIVKIESDAFHMSKEMTEKDMIGRIKNYPDTFLVAEEEGKVVAHVFGPAFEKRYIEDKLYFENHPNQEEDAYQTILSLAVAPECRKRGIATELLDRMAQVAKLENRRAISLTCLPKLFSFYEKRGYQNEGKTTDDIPDPDNESSYNMVKKL